MVIMIVYVLLATVGEVVAVSLGMLLDNVVPDGWNMIVAMALFFGVIFAMWPVAVFVTERWFMSPDAVK
jgi:hypothetical protein